MHDVFFKLAFKGMACCPFTRVDIERPIASLSPHHTLGRYGCETQAINPGTLTLSSLHYSLHWERPEPEPASDFDLGTGSY